jgi:hypothetical protein
MIGIDVSVYFAINYGSLNILLDINSAYLSREIRSWEGISSSSSVSGSSSGCENWKGLWPKVAGIDCLGPASFITRKRSFGFLVRPFFALLDWQQRFEVSVRCLEYQLMAEEPEDGPLAARNRKAARQI